MKIRNVVLLLLVCLPCVFAWSQIPNTSSFTTCAGASGGLTLARVNDGDSTQHDPANPGGHSVGFIPVMGCIYTHTNLPNCTTACSVISAGATPLKPLGGMLLTESGPLLTQFGGSHLVSGNWADGAAGGVGIGATCTAQMGGAAINCGTTGTKCAIGVTLSAGGVTVSKNDGSSDVWSSKPAVSIPLTCATIADPQNKGLHFVPPDPCLDGTAISPVDITKDAVNNPDCSPIIIDVTGNGIILTPSAVGVHFDMKGTGVKSIVAWTQPGTDAQGFLALDRNGNGTIDDGTELFGNFTPQPFSPTPNGFAALAEFDKPENGGNGNGSIDPGDSVWSKLLVWVDYNHDGISQPEELKHLADYHISAIDLNYRESKHTDDYGNAFRYRAKIVSDNSGKGTIGRWAWDVFLTVTRDPAREQ